MEKQPVINSQVASEDPPVLEGAFGKASRWLDSQSPLTMRLAKRGHAFEEPSLGQSSEV